MYFGWIITITIIFHSLFLHKLLMHLYYRNIILYSFWCLFSLLVAWFYFFFIKLFSSFFSSNQWFFFLTQAACGRCFIEEKKFTMYRAASYFLPFFLNIKHMAYKRFPPLWCDLQHSEKTYGIFESDVMIRWSTHPPLALCKVFPHLPADWFVDVLAECRVSGDPGNWNHSLYKHIHHKTHTHTEADAASALSAAHAEMCERWGGNHLRRRHLSSFSQARDSATHSSSYHLMKRRLRRSHPWVAIPFTGIAKAHIYMRRTTCPRTLGAHY